MLFVLFVDYDFGVCVSLFVSYVIGWWYWFVKGGFQKLLGEQVDVYLWLILQ